MLVISVAPVYTYAVDGITSGAGAISGASIATSNATGGSVGNTSAVGGTGGTSNSTVGNLSTGSSTSQGGSVGNTNANGGTSTSTTGASTSQGGTASSSGNTSGNTTVTTTHQAAQIPVATAYSSSNHPTAPCMGASSVGVSSMVFGISTGSSWEATECMKLELARSFAQSGYHEDAQSIRCSSKYAAVAPSCIKLLTASKPKVVYSETVDPITGFVTIIDTRSSSPIRRQ